MLFTTEKDVVFIEGLIIKTIIGLYKWERCIKQPIEIDVLLFTDTQKVAQSNDLKNGVNYKVVSDDLTEWTQKLKSELVEELAEELAKKLLKKYAINKVTLKISKPIAIKQASRVGVQITRKQATENNLII